MKRKSFAAIVCACALLVVAFSIALGKEIEVDRFVVPLSFEVDGHEYEVELVVDVAGRTMKIRQVGEGDDPVAKVGDIEYLGKVRDVAANEPVATLTPQVEDLDALKANATDVSFDDMARRNKELRNVVVHFSGQVDKVSMSSEQGPKRIAIRTVLNDYGWEWQNTVWVDNDSDLLLLEGDEVEVWAHLTGLERGSSELHPTLEAVHIEVTSDDDSVPEKCVESSTKALSAATIEELVEAATDASPMDIARFLDDCRGAVVQFSGVVEAADYGRGEIDVDTDTLEGNWSSDNYRVEVDKDAVFLIGDKVTVIGIVDDELFVNKYWTSADIGAFDEIQPRVSATSVQITE